MIQFEALAKEQRKLKMLRKGLEERDKEVELGKDETADSMDFQALLQDSMTAENIDVYVSVSASAGQTQLNQDNNAVGEYHNHGNDNDSESASFTQNGLVEEDDTIDTAAVDGLLNFDDSIEDLRDESGEMRLSLSRRQSGANVASFEAVNEVENEDVEIDAIVDIDISKDGFQLEDNKDGNVNGGEEKVVQNEMGSFMKQVGNEQETEPSNELDKERERSSTAVATESLLEEQHGGAQGINSFVDSVGDGHPPSGQNEGMEVNEDDDRSQDETKDDVAGFEVEPEEMEILVRHARSNSKTRDSIIHMQPEVNERPGVNEPDNTSTTKEVLNTSMNQSMIRNPRTSFGSSPFLKMNIPVSSRRGRRHSLAPRNENSAKDSVFRKSAQSMRKLTSSMQKAKRVRANQRLRRLSRSSLPSTGRSHSPGFPVFQNMEHTSNNETLPSGESNSSVTATSESDPTRNAADPNMTFDVDDGENKINDLLVDLVANNNDDDDDGDDPMDCTPIEKLDLSTAKGYEESPPKANVSTPSRLSSILNQSDYDRVYYPSPGRSTRSKKRMSFDGAEESLSLPESKKSDRKSTPRKDALSRTSGSVGKRGSIRKILSRRQSIDSDASSTLSEGEDDTHMMMEYLVPNRAVEEREGSQDRETADMGLNGSIAALPFSQETGASETSTLLLSQPVSSQGTNSFESSNPLLNDASSQVSSPARDTINPENKNESINNDSSVDGSLGLRSLSNQNHSFAAEVQSELSSSNGVLSVDANSTANFSTDTNELLQKSFDEKKAATYSSASDVAAKSPFAPPTSTKTKKIEVSSPLSGDEIENDDIGEEMISLGSPASNSSSDMSYQSKGSDGVTANTAALRDIMADLTDDFNKSPRMEKKKRRRRSSAFSLSSLSQNGNEDTTTSIRRIDVDTADTQDLKGIMSDFDLRGSSLLPINENKDDDEDDVSTNNIAETHAIKSPEPVVRSSAVVQTPKSILKRYKGGESTPKRNVVFCPPVAAEYNIGSPASNFTPMSAKVTKKLFTIPRKEGEKETSSESESENDDESMDTESIEEEKGTIENTISSPIDYSANSDESSNASSSLGTPESVSPKTSEGQTVSLELDLGTMLNTVAESREEPAEGQSMCDSSACNDETKSLSLRDSSMLRIMDGETQTVGLEGDLQRLLEKYNERKNADSSPKQNISNSGDSTHTGADDNFSLNDTSDTKDGSEVCIEGEEEHTVALESGMIDIISNLQSGEKNEPSQINFDDTGTLSLRDTSMMKSMNGETIGLDKDLKSIFGQVEQLSDIAGNETGVLSLRDTSIMQTMNGDTVGLDNDLRGMLDQIEKPLEIDGDDSSSNTGNLSSRNVNSTKDGTVELENGLQGMLNHVVDTSRLSEGDTLSDSESFKATGNSSLDADAIENSNTMDLETGLQDMIGKVDLAASKNADKYSNGDDTISLQDMSILQKSEGDTMDLETGLQDMIGKVDLAASKIAHRDPNDDDTISLQDMSILQKSEGDTVGLENDLRVLVDIAVGDKGHKTHSPRIIRNDNATGSRDHGELSSSGEDELRVSDTESLKSNIMLVIDPTNALVDSNVQSPTGSVSNASDTSNMIRSIENAIGDNSDHANAEANTSLGSSGFNRRSSRRFSLVPSSDISESPSDLLNGSFSETSPYIDEIIDASEKSEEIVEVLEDECIIDMKWNELSNFLPHLMGGTLLGSITDLLLNGSGTMLAEYNHPIVLEKVNEFLAGVCNEIENNGNEGTIDPGTIITQCIENQDSELHNLQEALRGELSHGDMTAYTTELKALDEAITETAKDDFTNWEVQVMSALGNSIEQMKFEVDDDLQDVDRQLNISNEIQSSLSTISRRLVKKSQMESIQRKKVCVGFTSPTFKFPYIHELTQFFVHV